jgi:hypothetical protein
MNIPIAFPAPTMFAFWNWGDLDVPKLPIIYSGDYEIEGVAERSITHPEDDEWEDSHGDDRNREWKWSR